MVLQRLGGVNQTLVARVPGSVPFYASSTAAGTEALNSNQLQPGLAAGPRLRLMYHDQSGYGIEASYFHVVEQTATSSVGPDGNWLVMRAPGTFWQTQDFPYQAMTWSSSTSLYSAELNGRFDLSRRVTLLAGVRWFQLNDNLQGDLAPADLTAPGWKQTCVACTLFQVTDGSTPAGNYPPFWTTSTTNNLYGVQVGVDGRILELGRLSLNGLIKLGLFDNNAEQTTGVSLQKVVYSSTATTSQPAFASEASLQVRYELIKGLALKAGYQALWLAGVALAPGQIQDIYTASSSVRAVGVNTGSNVLFQGATLGLEVSF